MPLSLGRVVLIIGVCSLLSAGLTVVSVRGSAPPPPIKVATPNLPTLTVPDLRGDAYVFAKSTLESGGFAWRLRGRTEGYAAMLVAEQSPAPGTVLLDSGDPIVTLKLLKPRGYVPAGEPQSASPYPGTEPEPAAGPVSATTGRAPQATLPALGSAASIGLGASAKAPKRAAPTVRARAHSPRPPAFRIAGAKSEPLDEMPLPERARLLDRWLRGHLQPTSENQRHWLYQHAWIVAGARFGWWHGAQALRLLIAVDRRAERAWGIGSESEQVARQALAFVQAHSR
ncbi:MAG: PASTA domain-containing protein [Gaiellaceae bacterium]